jgi:hypothetical protein
MFMHEPETHRGHEKRCDYEKIKPHPNVCPPVAFNAVHFKIFGHVWLLMRRAPTCPNYASPKDGKTSETQKEKRREYPLFFQNASSGSVRRDNQFLVGINSHFAHS